MINPSNCAFLLECNWLEIYRSEMFEVDDYESELGNKNFGINRFIIFFLATTAVQKNSKKFCNIFWIVHSSKIIFFHGKTRYSTFYLKKCEMWHDREVSSTNEERISIRETFAKNLLNEAIHFFQNFSAGSKILKAHRLKKMLLFAIERRMCGWRGWKNELEEREKKLAVVWKSLDNSS